MLLFCLTVILAVLLYIYKGRTKSIKLCTKKHKYRQVGFSREYDLQTKRYFTVRTYECQLCKHTRHERVTD